MALIDMSLAQEIISLLRHRYRLMEEALGGGGAQEGCSSPRRIGSLLADLELLIGVANGLYHRTDEMVQRVEAALVRLLDLLCGNALGQRAVIPEQFWYTDTGIVISRARWWVSSDDLISISNAAALAFGENTQATRMRIARAIEQGVLDWVPDPSVTNPQQHKRVLRPQVERLRDQRRLPE